MPGSERPVDPEGRPAGVWIDFGSRTGRRPTAERVLIAAERCFARHGIAKTTMDDIAREAGVTRPTIYRYFPDRDTLLMAAMDRRFHGGMERARKYIQSRPSFTDKIVDGLIYLIEAGDNDPLAQAMLSPDQLATGTALLGASGEGARMTRELWEPILLAAQEAGEMRHDLDPVQACAWLAHLQLSFMMRINEFSRHPETRRQFLERFVAPAMATDGR
jgi:AcrR family transcriptional regulator